MNYLRLFFLALALFCTYLQAQNAHRPLKIEYLEINQGIPLSAQLIVDNNEAYYSSSFDDSLSEETTFSMNDVVITARTSQLKYNLQTDSIYQIAKMKKIHPKGVLIGEKREEIRWLFVDSTREINGHLCKLAKGSFRGRLYHAWYDPEVNTKRVGP